MYIYLYVYIYMYTIYRVVATKIRHGSYQFLLEAWELDALWSGALSVAPAGDLLSCTHRARCYGL